MRGSLGNLVGTVSNSRSTTPESPSVGPAPRNRSTELAQHHGHQPRRCGISALMIEIEELRPVAAQSSTSHRSRPRPGILTGVLEAQCATLRSEPQRSGLCTGSYPKVRRRHGQPALTLPPAATRTVAIFTAP